MRRSILPPFRLDRFFVWVNDTRVSLFSPFIRCLEACPGADTMPAAIMSQESAGSQVRSRRLVGLLAPRPSAHLSKRCPTDTASQSDREVSVFGSAVMRL
jgi:hypothetical protein